ncbi:glycoside hydrolase family 76 protein [Niabella insulamsoli]|uniref:glycoside hydrolase family 76 protein n=1 Tax=Niabella insulamsoli TaxID=3144874 RepID=UPI0031FE1FD7
MNIYRLFAILLIGSIISCSKFKDEYTYGETQNIDWNAAADSATNALIAQFWNESGYFNYGSNGSNNGFQYWPNAHAMDVVIDAYLRTNNSAYSAYFDKWFAGIKTKNGNTYYNVFYDDMEWNALTFVRLYKATNDAKYLDAAKDLWNDIIGGWNETYAEGGLAWKKDMPYSKNACSNGPAAILGVRLYEITNDESYKEWALKIYDWEKNTLYEWATGGIYDNINGETGAINSVVLTYNTGTFVGAAVELYRITKDVAYLNDAQKCANYTITKCIDSGNNVLRDEGTGDNALFKGIFIRYYLMLLQEPDLNDDYRTKFVNFFNNNAINVWTKATYKQSLLFGSSWIAPPAGEAQLTAQASACMMIEAKAAFDKSDIE